MEEEAKLSLGEALPLEIARVRDEIMPMYIHKSLQGFTG